ncbi:MAG: helix-turn-helix transcriptional regulator [Schwartzia succinivorans]|nr:helix-turn-helix transcriptional regulator [Schwartzia succinivorans]
MSIFSDNLKRYRFAAGFSTAKDFAKALNLPYNTYLNYETKDSEPKYDLLCKIADILNVTTDELLGRSSKTLFADSRVEMYKKLGKDDAHITDTPVTSKFDDLRNLMAEFGFFIRRDPDSPPHPKYGERVIIVYEHWGFKKTTFDFLYRMYLLIPRLWQSENYLAYSQFARALMIHYGVMPRPSVLDDEDHLLLGHENMFEEIFASKTAEEIKDIIEGRTDNPFQALYDVPYAAWLSKKDP